MQTHNLQAVHASVARPRFSAKNQNGRWVVFDRLNFSHNPCANEPAAIERAGELNSLAQGFASHRRLGFN